MGPLSQWTPGGAMKGLSYSAKTTLLRTRGRAAEKEKGGRTWGPSVVTGSMTKR